MKGPRSAGSWCMVAALFALVAVPSRLSAQGMCFEENECTFRKPNILVVMDYSSSMVGSSGSPAYFPTTQTTDTRWDAQLDAVRSIIGNTDFTDNMHIALARFAHDPDTSTGGTTITGDTSSPPITDGFAVDIAFDDAGGEYLDCNAGDFAAVLDALEAAPPPTTDSGGINDVMGTWTRGALISALDLIQTTRASHTGEPGEAGRTYEVILMSDGEWNCPDSFDQSTCDGDPGGEADEDPAPQAAILLGEDVRVHVVGFADASAVTSLNETAFEGGTDAAIDATSPQELNDALDGVLAGVRDAVVVPECIGGLPRVMIIMDASSSMLVGNAPGDSNWDKARYALGGNPQAPDPGDPGYVEPLFDREVDVNGNLVTIEDVVHIGLMAFNTADTQELMLQYAPCARDNIQWSMDPYTSCDAPGCTDPYSGEPQWTFKNSDTDRVPPFVNTTYSFMPPCNSGGTSRCLGTMYNTFTGEGVQFASDNVTAYTADPGAFNVDAATPFVNILVTDGETSPGSASVEPVLTAMDTAGIPTYVIGFGTPAALNEAQLDAYAAAGGTGTAVTVDPTQGGSADSLAEAIATIIGGVGIDPCCQLNDCSQDPEPALPLCGNGVVEAGEACDDGDDNGAYDGTCNFACSSTQAPSCGDAIVNGPEVCDDGINDRGYDRCAPDCDALGPHCGDGIMNGPEACDDGDDDDDDECRNDCSGSCGDGELNGSEVCDDGVNSGGYGGCFSDCSGLGPYCGDGVVNGSEACDDGADNGTYDHCLSNCNAMGPTCGDGSVDSPDETCDDGNTTAGDGCDASCQMEAPTAGTGGTGGMATGGTGGDMATGGTGGDMATAGTGGMATAGTGGDMATAGAGAAGAAGAPVAGAAGAPVAGAAGVPGAGTGAAGMGFGDPFPGPGSGSGSGEDDDGCGCRVPGGQGRAPGGASLALLGLLGALVLRRRRR